MKKKKVTKDRSSEAVFKPSGDLTIFEAEQFHADLIALQQQEGPLELNLADVEQIDSSCVQLIVASTRCGRLKVMGISNKVRERFEKVGFTEFLPQPVEN